MILSSEESKILAAFDAGFNGVILESPMLRQAKSCTTLFDMNDLKSGFRLFCRLRRAKQKWASYLSNIDNAPFWLYSAMRDPRSTPAHVKISGMVFKWDNPVWDKIFPPNHMDCRCGVRCIDAQYMSENGLSLSKEADLDFEGVRPHGWSFHPKKATEETIAVCTISALHEYALRRRKGEEDDED